MRARFGFLILTLVGICAGAYGQVRHVALMGAVIKTRNCVANCSISFIGKTGFEQQNLLSANDVRKADAAVIHSAGDVRWIGAREKNHIVGRGFLSFAQINEPILLRKAAFRIVCVPYVVRNDFGNEYGKDVYRGSFSKILIEHINFKGFPGNYRSFDVGVVGAHPSSVVFNDSLSVQPDSLPGCLDGGACENGSGDGAPHSDAADYDGPHPITPLPFAMATLFGVPLIFRAASTNRAWLTIVGFLLLVAGSAGLIFDVVLWFPPIFS